MTIGNTPYESNHSRLPEYFDPTTTPEQPDQILDTLATDFRTNILPLSARVMSFCAVRQGGGEEIPGSPPRTQLSLDSSTLRVTATTCLDPSSEFPNTRPITDCWVRPDGTLHVRGENHWASVAVRRPDGTIWRQPPVRRPDTPVRSHLLALPEGRNVILLHTQDPRHPYARPSLKKLHQALNESLRDVGINDPLAAQVIAANMLDDNAPHAPEESMLALIVNIDRTERRKARNGMTAAVSTMAAIAAASACVLGFVTPPSAPTTLKPVLPVSASSQNVATLERRPTEEEIAAVVKARERQEAIDYVRGMAGATTIIALMGLAGAGLRMRRARSEAAKAWERRQKILPLIPRQRTSDENNSRIVPPTPHTADNRSKHWTTRLVTKNQPTTLFQ